MNIQKRNYAKETGKTGRKGELRRIWEKYR